MSNNTRRIHIREHVSKQHGRIDQVEFEVFDCIESDSMIEHNYNLWLTRDHYIKTITKRYGYNSSKMPTFEEYLDAIRPLIAGHCCPEHELRRVFKIYDQNRNGNIDLDEFYRFISIIGRSTTKRKLLDFIERVNISNSGTLNYEQFKNFVRLGYGREMLVNVSMEE